MTRAPFHLLRKEECLTPNYVTTRVHTVSIRMTDEELEMLRAVAEVSGLGLSDWVRQRVRREHIKRFPKGMPSK